MKWTVLQENRNEVQEGEKQNRLIMIKLIGTNGLASTSYIKILSNK